MSDDLDRLSRANAMRVVDSPLEIRRHQILIKIAMPIFDAKELRADEPTLSAPLAKARINLCMHHVALDQC